MLLRLGGLFVALFLGVATVGMVSAFRAPPAPAAPVDPAAFVRPPDDVSRAPAPVQRGGLTALAEPVGDRLALHTAGGDLTFWTGVNLGSTTPGHNPGELAVSREDYRRWFGQMTALGVRVLRVYTIHPPHMYEELRAHNQAHPTTPLYLAQGVYLTEESYVETQDLYEPGPTAAFTQELQDASDAVHGVLSRPVAPGRATGQWTADVSDWLVSWIIGVEWEPDAVRASDARNAAVPEFTGRYFASVPDDTPTTATERWLTSRMDELATAEAAKGSTAPIAFVNWPTTDPLDHPTEEGSGEDVVGIDADHVRATPAWPGGTFASFHAYPYFPDFLQHDEAYQRFELDGDRDPYAGYLAALDADLEVPLMITELGVPSSLGSAHEGTLGRHQGDHSEQGAVATDAALVRLAARLDLAGAFVFAWNDEWFKFTWNTRPRQAVADSGRRALWHDVLTNEQYFGLLADDPLPVGRRVLAESRTGVREVSVDHDASYLHLGVVLEGEPTEPVRLGFDVVPGGLALPGGSDSTAYDVAVVVDPVARSTTASVRADLDPLLMDGLPPQSVPPADADGWVLQRLTTSLPVPLRGAVLPAEFQDVGTLREGVWNVSSPEADSRATWQLDGVELRLRLPWALLLLGDPSSRTAVVPVDGRPVGVPVAEVGLLVDAGPGGSAVSALRWEPWHEAQHRERLKPGLQRLVDAWAEVSPAR